MNQINVKVPLLVIVLLAGFSLFASAGCSLSGDNSAVSSIASPSVGSPPSDPAVSASPTQPASATAAPAETRAGGAEIAFIRDDDLWTSAADGSEHRKLTVSGQVRSLTWSSDGKKIAMEEGQDLSAGLAVVDLSSGDKKVLAEETGEFADPVWSPDGSQIAYAWTADTNGDGLIDRRDRSEIWLIDAEGHNRRKVVEGRDPSWSPDGSRLAYVGNGDPTPGPPYRTGNTIQSVGLATGAVQTILAVKDVPEDLSSYNYPFKPSTILLQHPVWSPDGLQIAFSTVGHTGMVGLVGANGKDLRLLDFNYEGGFGRVKWAPTGKSIASESFPPSGISHVVVDDLRSGKTANIGKEPSGPSVTSPSWSADANYLLVVGLDGVPYLASVKPDGTGLRKLMTGAIAEPTWNPAGEN